MNREYPLSPELRQKLEGQSTEMKTDKFWRDMAKPIDMALRSLKDYMEAMDSVSAKEYRKNATKSFESAETELAKSAEHGVWVIAHDAVKAALAVLRGEAPPVPSATPPPAAPVATTATAAAAAQPAPAPAVAPPEAAAKADVPPAATAGKAVSSGGFDVEAARQNPFKWEQDDEGSVSVTVAVPADCKKSEISVAFGSTHLKVSVKGHPLQPVIDSDLLYSIQPGECSWGLEGSGSKRKLAITLEKVQSELEWTGLLDDEEGRRKKSLTELAMGVEGMGPLKSYTGSA